MTTMQMVGAALFGIAILHTFSTKFFEWLAHHRPAHAGLWHILGEVEVVFGFWAMVMMFAMIAILGTQEAATYLDTRNFTEPLFVFAIVVVAGSRAVLHLGRQCVGVIARFVPLQGGMAFYFVALSFLPLLGSFITEPAAMTLAAMMLRDRVFGAGVSTKLKYATLGVLFVNVSIGGTLTSFAAPPVLMVAAKWNWDSWYMFSHFGWKAAVAVCVNAMVTTVVFKRELAHLPKAVTSNESPMPAWVTLVHVVFLAGVVILAHHPAAFLGLFLFFIGFAQAYPKFQDERLLLREGLLVAFFLAGLVVLGGQQQWWLEPLLLGMDASTVYAGATALTAVTDNAALTYLGSLVEGLSDEFKYALVAGAVTGGGLTVIANAPNPAGFAILRGNFEDESIHPLGLLIAATPPTITAIIAFRML
ncbi:putative Na+/H+ antiporter [Rhodoferax sp. AJA081-3]|uniref:putative Na+/H+ antiporter n=1 Tax=Rhodoferax sp. AJA081-3 TaxID=2752316 RepID=UPI001ADF2DD9|nr:putative Na+/H+ antiporter [Rhodoferax sp. AJA081-3]QTN29695.1 putative Na+/H+ antiporter [Rhodoferax sp. AJA081-3]